MTDRRALPVAILLVLMAAVPGRAQVAPAQPAAPAVFTLEQAIQYAVDHYPSVRAALEQVNASEAGVSVARAAYLPRLDSIWQSNRATANNVFGQLLPQSVLPALSGPVLPSATGASVWGSAAGALFSWEPLDFGLRNASIAVAEAAVTRARADEALTRIEVQAAVGAAFLSMLGAERAVTTAQADLDRRDVLGRTAHALVDNQLRPGVEASRADAERAAAQTRLIQAQQGLTLAQAMMVRLLGFKTGPVSISAAGLLDQLPAPAGESATAAAHPLAQLHQAAVDFSRAQATILARTDFPRVFVQSSVMSRGSGADPGGTFDGSAKGLGLDRANWAAGVQIVFPNVFDFSSLRARKTAAAATERAEAARYDEALLTITNQQDTANAMLQAARAVAANTPLQLAAAEQNESQARARYQAGLTGLVEVADAQSLLAQADMQDQLARVDVWRALLAQSAARGDLAPFVAAVHSQGAR